MFVLTEKERILNFKGFRRISIITVTFFFMLLIKPASAQLMNLYDLPERKTALSFGYGLNDNRYHKESDTLHTIVVSLDWGHTADLKTSIMTDFSWDPGTTTQILPLFGLKAKFMHIGKIWMPHLGYFFQSDWGGGQTYLSGIRSIDLFTTTSSGIFLNLAPASSTYVIKPFVAISHSLRFNLKSNSYFNNPRIEGGIEFQIMEYFSFLIRGSREFDKYYPIVSGGMNFYF